MSLEKFLYFEEMIAEEEEEDLLLRDDLLDAYFRLPPLLREVNDFFLLEKESHWSDCLSL